MSLQLPGFEVLEQVGAGAFSKVFRVRRLGGVDHEALRLETEPRSPESSLPLTDSRTLPRHPHLLRAIQSGVDPLGRHWQLFPLVQPRDASSLVEVHGPPTALALLCQATSGLAALHLSGSHHGDVSRENLLVQDTGSADPWEAGFLHIADFGGAERFGLGGDSQRTLTGTLGYLPPEALANEAHRSSPPDDVFGLGAWLCWLISGKELLRGDSLADTLDRYRSPRALAARLLATRPKYQTKFWSDLTEILVHEDPAKRPVSAVQLADWLRARAHLVPEFGARLPRLLWNPFGLTPDEAEACRILVDVAGEKNRRQIRVSGISPGRLPEFVAETCRALHVAENEALFVSRVDPLEGAVERIQTGRHRLLLLDRAGSETDDRLETLLEAWRFQTVTEASESESRLVIEFAPSSVRPEGLVAPPGREDRAAEIVIGAGAHEQTLGWLSWHFSGTPVDPVFERQLKSRGPLSPAVALEVVRTALGARDLRVDLTGIRVEDDRVETLLDVILEPAHALVQSVSPRARALLFALGVGGETIARDLGSTRFLAKETWLRAIGELLDSGVVDRDPSTGLPLVRIGVQLPRALDPEELYELSSLSQALLACDQGGLGSQTRRLARSWGGSADAGTIRGALAVAQVSFLTTDFVRASRILELEPSQETSEYWRGRWKELHARVEAAMGCIKEALTLLESAIELFQSCGKDRRAAYASLEYADQLGNIGKISESIEALLKAQMMIGRGSDASADRLWCRLQAEVAFRSRMGGRSPEAASMAEAVLAQRPPDAGARAIALKVLSDTRYRQDKTAEARSLMAAALVEGRRSGSADIFARVLIGVANHEFSHGRYARSGRLVRRVEKMSPVLVRATNRFAALVALGGIAYESGLLKDALRANVRALAIGRAEGNERKIRFAAANLSVILSDMVQPGSAIEIGLTSTGSGGERSIPTETDPRLQLGDAWAYIGDFESLASITDRIDEEDGLKKPTAERGRVRHHRGTWYHHQGRAAEATQFLGLAVQELQAAGPVDDCLQARVDLFRCNVAGLSASARQAEIEALFAEGRRVGNWRLLAQIRLLDLEWSEDRPFDAFLSGLAALERECLERGYLILELPILEARARRQIREGWSVDALATLRHAVERVKLIAQGIADERLRRIYLGDPRRRVLLDLIEEARRA